MTDRALESTATQGSSDTSTNQRIPRPVDLTGARIGRFQVIGHLASGGMANVYVGRAEGDLGFERLVALKRIHDHLRQDRAFVTMFASEASISASLRHPNVIATHDVISDDASGLFLVMDYVEGLDLHALIRARRALGATLPPRVAARIVLDLLAALAMVHGRVGPHGEPAPIVHRDVSPHNLLVGTDGASRLCDFGIARAQMQESWTLTGEIRGKLGYIAPERLYGHPASPSSDLFSAGVVLWETLTGARLFLGESQADTLRRVVEGNIPDVSAFVPAAAPFDAPVRRALARRPEDRAASAAELADEILRAANACGGVAGTDEVSLLLRESCREALAQRAELLRVGRERLARMDASSRDGRPLRPGALRTRDLVAARGVATRLGLVVLGACAAAGVAYYVTTSRDGHAAQGLRRSRPPGMATPRASTRPSAARAALAPPRTAPVVPPEGGAEPPAARAPHPPVHGHIHGPRHAPAPTASPSPTPPAASRARPFVDDMLDPWSGP